MNERLKINLSHIEGSIDSGIPIGSAEDGLFDLKEWLENTRGKTLLGIPQHRLPSIDKRLLGLRKMILLAAPPNVGKTALGTQLTLDALMNDQNVCVVIFSLEMSARDILIRILLNLSGMEFEKFVFGDSSKDSKEGSFDFFNAPDSERIHKAEEVLLEIGERLQIVEGEMCPGLSAQQAISYINKLKERTGCGRVLVLVDYLQVWPLSGNTKFYSEQEMDKWRIGQMKQIRDAISDDPIIVISESRKPSSKVEWGSELSDIIGSVRLSYTPDIVFLYTPFPKEELAKMWKAQKLQVPSDRGESTHEGDWIQGHLKCQGIGLYRLDIAKGRDGVEKGVILLVFDFRKSSFRELNWGELKSLPEQKRLLVNRG